MEIIQGKGISAGISRGKIRLIRQNEKNGFPANHSGTPDTELEDFRRACEELTKELAVLASRARETAGEAEAEIFDIHRMMLEDEGFTEPTEAAIRKGQSAQEAIAESGRELARLFSSMDDPYMKAREADICALADRLIGILNGTAEAVPTADTPVILAAEDLTPAQTVELDPEIILGFVTEKGSSTSHTAILARSMGIPAIAAVGSLPEGIEGREAILDGGKGILYVDPTRETQEEYTRILQIETEQDTGIGGICGNNGIRLYANAGSLGEVKAAYAAGAEGIGLFRSEYLFMQYDRCPTEEEQFLLYRNVLQTMGDKEVTIRTLDAGADKQISWLNRDAGEANPALGLRAVRVCLANPRLLYIQLRALYRAAVYGNLRVMIPMITIPEELEQVRQIAENVRAGLAAEGIPFAPTMPIGIMIETPSAALLAEILAEKAAFFSLGTNDLTQYTMAADRENASVAHLTEKLPMAVEILIRMTAEAARKAEIPVSVCGEAAADITVIPKLLEMGITTLSVAPSQIQKVRKTVMQQTSAEKNKG